MKVPPGGDAANATEATATNTRTKPAINRIFLTQLLLTDTQLNLFSFHNRRVAEPGTYGRLIKA